MPGSMPQAMKCSGKREVARGRVRAYRVGKTMVLQWPDKCNVTILSITETCNMVTVHTFRGVKNERAEVVEL